MKGGVKVDVFGINAHVIVDPCDFGAPEHTPWIKKVSIDIQKTHNSLNSKTANFFNVNLLQHARMQVWSS